MPKLAIIEKRMLELIEWSVKTGLFPNREALYAEVGIFRQNMKKIREGEGKFGAAHIQKICEVTGANANWILGFEGTMLRAKQR